MATPNKSTGKHEPKPWKSESSFFGERQLTFHEGLFLTPAFGCEASPHADLGWYQVQLSLMPSSSAVMVDAATLSCRGTCCQDWLLPSRFRVWFSSGKLLSNE